MSGFAKYLGWELSVSFQNIIPYFTIPVTARSDNPLNGQKALVLIEFECF